MPGPLDALIAAGTVYVQKRTTDKQLRAASKTALPPAPATTLTIETPAPPRSSAPPWLLPVGLGVGVLALGLLIFGRR